MSITESRTASRSEEPDGHFVQGLAIERARLLHERAAVEERTLKGWNSGRWGGVHRVREVRSRVALLTRLVSEATAHGSKRHRTVPRLLRWLALVPVTTDFSIVALYFSVVLNVPLDRPLETPVQSATATVFALVISLGLFLALRWIAVRRRGFKNDSGRFEVPETAGRWQSHVESAVVAALLVGLAMVMLVRVFADARDAGVSVGAVWVVAGFLSLVTATLNWCLYRIEFADGSEETHEIDHWGRQLRVVDRHAERIEARLREIDAVLTARRAG